MMVMDYLSFPFLSLPIFLRIIDQPLFSTTLNPDRLMQADVLQRAATNLSVQLQQVAEEANIKDSEFLKTKKVFTFSTLFLFFVV
jgi:hypothetical protein